MSSELPNQAYEPADRPAAQALPPPPLPGQAEAADWTPQDWRPPPSPATTYGDVPPTQNQLPQWPSYPPLLPAWDKPQNRSWNGLAIASFVLGILPGSLIAVGPGIGALIKWGAAAARAGGWRSLASYWARCGRRC